MIQFELENNILEGIYNLANLGYVSHYDYGVIISRILGLEKQISKVEPLKREYNYGRYLMDVSKLNDICPLTHWESDSLIKI